MCLTILSESMIKFCLVISTYYGREQNYILYQNDIQKFLKNMTYDKKVKYECKQGHPYSKLKSNRNMTSNFVDLYFK